MSAIEHNPLFDECDCQDCRFWEAIGPHVDKYRDTRERREAETILKAVRLAPALNVCEALLRGEPVPKTRLDPSWRKAYGL